MFTMLESCYILGYVALVVVNIDVLDQVWLLLITHSVYSGPFLLKPPLLESKYGHMREVTFG